MSRSAAWCIALLVFNGTLASAQESDQGPIKVEIGIFVLDLFSINSVDQQTSLDFVVRMRWRDESLKGGSDSTRLDS